MPATASLPSFDVLLGRLFNLVEGGVDLDPDLPIGDLALDSLELVEWFYSVEEDLPEGVELELDDNTVEQFFDLSLRELYGVMAATVAGLDCATVESPQSHA